MRNRPPRLPVDQLPPPNQPAAGFARSFLDGVGILDSCRYHATSRYCSDTHHPVPCPRREDSVLVLWYPSLANGQPATAPPPGPPASNLNDCYDSPDSVRLHDGRLFLSLSLCLPHLFTVQPFFLDTPFYHRFLACIAFAPAFPSLPLHLPSLPCDSPRGTFPLLLCTSCSLSHHLASRGPHVGSSVFACVSSILCIIQLVVFFLCFSLQVTRSVRFVSTGIISV